jgi:folate-binding protein YgfZ
MGLALWGTDSGRGQSKFCMSVSTLQDKLTARGAISGAYRGAGTPVSFGNPAGEFRALVESCGMYDMSWQAKLVLTGEDRVRWLNGMVTNNVRDLGTGHGVYNFLLTAQGRIVADLVAYNRGDFLLVTSDRTQVQAIAEMFDRYIIMDDVEVADVSDKLSAIGIEGPLAVNTLQKAGIEVSQLERAQVVDLVCRNIGISVARNTHPNVDSYEIWFAAGQADALWDALIDAGSTPVGSEAVEGYRIARGVPRYGLDLSQRDLPQETEQKHALSFTKGCYIGQEIVERIRARAILHRTFTGFLLDGEGELPQSGTKITNHDKNIGELTSVARIPFPGGERTVALGYLRREYATPGKGVQIGTRQATVQSIPFSD